MLRHGKGMVAARLPVPARDARKAVRDVLDLDVERGGIEQIEPAARTACAATRAESPGTVSRGSAFRHGAAPAIE